MVKEVYQGIHLILLSLHLNIFVPVLGYLWQKDNYRKLGTNMIFDAQKTAQSLEFDILYLMRSYSSVKTIWGLSHIILEGI